MSFILDALKKSESDRQRQSGPSLFEVKVAPPRRRLPIWAVAIALLLVINVVVISWMLLRHPETPKSVGESPRRPATQAVAATAPALAPGAPGAALSPDGASGPANPGGSAGSGSSAAPEPARTTAGEQRRGEAPDAMAGPGALPTGRVSGGDQSVGQTRGSDSSSDYAPAVEPAGAQSAGPSGSPTDALPLYQQIVGSADLPPLHLDLHVYAERPQDRFAMINMHRVGEGDSLPSGPQVEAIRPDGVVLAYHGTRFLLPRN